MGEGVQFGFKGWDYVTLYDKGLFKSTYLFLNIILNYAQQHMVHSRLTNQLKLHASSWVAKNSIKDEKEYEYKALFNNDTTKSEDCDFITTNINIFLDLG